MTIFGTVTGKAKIKNGWEFELNIKLNFFIISTLGTQSDGNCTQFFFCVLLVHSPAMGLTTIFIQVSSYILMFVEREWKFQWIFQLQRKRNFPQRMIHCSLWYQVRWLFWLLLRKKGKYIQKFAIFVRLDARTQLN